MSTASSIFDKIAPQYITDPDKADFIALSRGQISTCFYGTNTELAVALRAAHMMVTRDIEKAKYDSGGAGGEIASKREGDLSVSYHKAESGNSSVKDLYLLLSSYGKQLAELRAGSGAFIGVTGGLDNGCDSEI